MIRENLDNPSDRDGGASCDIDRPETRAGNTEQGGRSVVRKNKVAFGAAGAPNVDMRTGARRLVEFCNQ